jgi:hypothetical protein
LCVSRTGADPRHLTLSGSATLTHPAVAGSDRWCENFAGIVFLDVDDTVREVHRHAKQAATYGYTGTVPVNGINSFAIVPTLALDRVRLAVMNQRATVHNAFAPRVERDRRVVPV